MLSLQQIRSLGPNQEVWDPALSGFGARRQRSSAVSYIIMYRTPAGRLRRYTIGRHGKWTPDTARAEAKRLLGRVAAGDDPADAKQENRRVATMAELCDDYLVDANAGRLMSRRRAPKKASTVATDAGRIEHHIKPLLGRMAVRAVTRDDVERFMHDVAEGKTAKNEKSGKVHGLTVVTGGRGTATRTTGLLGSIFTYAVRKKLRDDNPCFGVTRFADRKRDRRLSDAEYRALGKGLSAAEGKVWPPALAAIRFTALTGWRSGEVTGLTWPEVDIERRTAILADSKTGRSVRPLSKAGCEVLASLPQSAGYVFKASRRSGKMSGLPSFFERVVVLGGLPPDVTPHVLRHSFASVAADLGLSDSTIATLLGHARHSVTSQYMHHADAVLLAAADAVADRITGLLEQRHART